MSKFSILSTGDFGFYSTTEHGITFKPETPRDQWLTAVQQLSSMYEGTELARQRTLMLLADALNFGQEAFGEEFSQAIDNTRQALGLTPKRIANAQAVYRKIEASRRRDGITLSHYDIISALEPAEQDRYMDMILLHKWGVADLRESVAEDHPKTKRGKDRKQADAVRTTDTVETTLQKLADVSNFLKENGVEILTKDWFPHMKNINSFFRKKWQPGHKKK